MRKPLLLVPAALLLTCGLAAASPPQPRDSTPAAEAVLDGRHLQFAIHFDAPIDHAASRLEITQDGNVIRTLRPLLDSSPTVLFASGEALPPGRYMLHWHVGAPFGGEVAEGDIPFSVKP
jgi:methionine-rich copper-binding protein CopC